VVKEVLDRLLAAKKVRERYGVSDQTIWRWLHDKNSGFPRPIRIQGRRYWRQDELLTWEASKTDGGDQ
jgi:predicted DNA-binding transcriptional regulator AlpA